MGTPSNLHPTHPGPRRVVIELSGFPGLHDIGSGADSFACPKCGGVLLERVEARKLSSLVFRCPGCGECSSLEPPRS
jgi:predicted RNA-binding Zn-ribbon protein involved in translation (DUF1610 family)